jgi:hypothetical protein
LPMFFRLSCRVPHDFGLINLADFWLFERVDAFK